MLIASRDCSRRLRSTNGGAEPAEHGRHDHRNLRLFAAADGACGDGAVPKCGTPIAQQTLAEIERTIRGLPAETRVMLLAPLVRGRRVRIAR